MKLTEFQIKRFWNKIKKGTPDQCWFWLKGKATFGYGRFKIKGKTYQAHRIAFLLLNGKFPKNNGCHSCDNPVCCNPNHIFDGTYADNSKDMVIRGRSLKGIKHNKAKLTENEVLEIRKLLSIGIEGLKIASQFQVTPATISAINVNKTWRHLN